MEPVAYYHTQAGTEVPVFDPADLTFAPIRFVLGGQQVAFMLTTDIAAATNAEINFVFGGTRYAATGIDPLADPEYTVDSFNWTDPVDADSQYQVTATISNNSVGEGQETVEYRVDGTVYDTATVDHSPGSSESISFYPTSPPEAGTYTHGVYTLTDSKTDTLTVEGAPVYTVTAMTPTNLSVTQGDTFSVDGTIENTGSASGAGEVRYHVGDRHAGTETTQTLNPGQSETVTFSTTASETPGHYTHMVTTDNDMYDGDIEITPEGILIDDFQHDQLTAYYQGGTADHDTTTAWAELGGRSLISNDTRSSWMRSFPEDNGFRDHNFSLDRYPQRGDTIRVVTQVQYDHDTGYNGNGHIFRFKFNAGGISTDFEYHHQMALIDPWHTFEDRYNGTKVQTQVPENFSAGDTVTYVFDWKTNDTVDIWIERNGEKVSGEMSKSVSSPGSNAGYGISIRSESASAKSMRVSHIIVE